MQLLHNYCYYVTIYRQRVVSLRAIPAHIFKSNVIFRHFWAWFWLQITFRVAVRTCRPVYNSVLVYRNSSKRFLHSTTGQFKVLRIALNGDSNYLIGLKMSN